MQMRMGMGRRAVRECSQVPGLVLLAHSNKRASAGTQGRTQTTRPTPRPALEKRRGGGSGTQNFVYQKWPDDFPNCKFGFFPTMVTLVLGEGGSRGRDGPSSYGFRPF